MKKLLIILLALVGLHTAVQANEVVADSAINYIYMASNQDTLIYYPADAFGAIPEAYFKAELSDTDSTQLTAQIVFTDCQLQYIWVPSNCEIQSTTPFIIALSVHESGASYEVRFAQLQPQSTETNTASPNARKLLRDGQVIIIRNGIQYTLMGQKR